MKLSRGARRDNLFCRFFSVSQRLNFIFAWNCLMFVPVTSLSFSSKINVGLGSGSGFKMTPVYISHQNLVYIRHILKTKKLSNGPKINFFDACFKHVFYKTKHQQNCFRHNCGMEANWLLLVNCLVETVLTFCFVLCLFKKEVSKYKNRCWHRERILK